MTTKLSKVQTQSTSKKTIFLAFFITVISASCGLRSLYLNHGDWLLKLAISDYFDLDSLQQEVLEKQLTVHWHWLMADKQAQVIVDLESFRAGIARGLKKPDVDVLRSRINFWRSILYSHLNSSVSQFLTEVRSEQVTHLKEKLDDWDKKWEVMLAEKDEKDFRAKLLDYHRDNFKRWYGSISDSQVQQLAETMPLSRNYVTEIIKQSRGSRAEFIKLISNPKTNETIAQGLRLFVIFPRAFRNSELRDSYDKMTEEFWQNFIARDALATAEQRTFAAEQVESLIEDWRKSIPVQAEKK